MNDNKQIDLFIEHVLVVANKFIDKVNSGMARSKETYADLQKLKKEAIALKKENQNREDAHRPIEKNISIQEAINHAKDVAKKNPGLIVGPSMNN